MELRAIRYEVADRVALITLDRPERLNAWTGRMDEEHRWAVDQAEHDPDAIAWLVTTSATLAERVPAELERLLERNPRRDVARAALEANGAIVIVDDLEQAAAVADLRAPEHLELLVAEPTVLAGRIRNAGAIFLGAHSPEPKIGRASWRERV